MSIFTFIRKYNVTSVSSYLMSVFLLPYFKPLIQTATFPPIFDLVCTLTADELIRGFSDRGVWKVSSLADAGEAIAGWGGVWSCFGLLGYIGGGSRG